MVMKTKEVKIPMIISIALYFTAVLVDLCCFMMQKSLIRFPLDKLVFPPCIITRIVVLLLLGAFMIAMSLYKGDSRKLVSWIMIGAYVVLSLAITYGSIWINQLIVTVSDQEHLAAVSTIESYCAMFDRPFTMGAVESYCAMFDRPFTMGAAICAFIAIGRYGVIAEKTEQE